MDSRRASEIFQEIASLLELRGDNPFKIRAYLSAADLLVSSKEPFAAFVEKAARGEIKGIGDALQAKLLELRKTGSLEYLEHLREDVPRGLLDMLELPGLGTKKVRALHEGLGIESIEELREACLSGKVSELSGFGEKLERQILESIEQRAQSQSRFLLGEALEEAEALLAVLRDNTSGIEFEITGELRRVSETVSHIQILAVDEDRSLSAQVLARIPDIASLEKEVSQCYHFVFRGIPVEIEVVSRKSFPSKLLFSTGSQTHVEALVRQAEVCGYFLKPEHIEIGGSSLSPATENEIYSFLGLPFIPPELREGPVERSTVISPLVSASDIRGLIHVHTAYSDGRNTLRDMALAVRDLGYDYLGVSDHSKSARYAGGLREEDIQRQHEEIDRLNEELAPFRIFKGIESDILADGSLDYEDAILDSFDFVIASVHSRFSMNKEEMTDRIVKAIKNPYTTILGHPTGRLLLSRKPYPLDIDRMLEAAAESKTAIEINANPKRLDLEWGYLNRARLSGVPLIISPDAHSTETLRHTRYGLLIARKGNLTAQDVLNCRSIASVDAYFRAQR